MFRVPNHKRIDGLDPEIQGNNGAFKVHYKNGIQLYIIASDGLQWEHVSVSLKNNKGIPTWDMMQFVKEIFWDDEDVVIQFHPRKSEYVNIHPGVLHLWRPIGVDLPTPLRIMV